MYDITSVLLKLFLNSNKTFLIIYVLHIFATESRGSDGLLIGTTTHCNVFSFTFQFS